MSHRLIVLPDDTADAILAPINAARHSMNIRMFLFTDPSLINAVIAAKRRGVKVRVMLNPARRDGTSDNEAARQTLRTAVTIIESAPCGKLTRLGGIPGSSLGRYAGRHGRQAGDSAKVGSGRLEAR